MPIAKIWDGKAIERAGCYSDLPLVFYHKQSICPGPSVSSTNLRRVLEVNGGSPAHFYSEWSGNPNRIEPADKRAWILGRLTHHLLLSQAFFSHSFIIRPDEVIDPRTGEILPWHGNRVICKEWLKDAADRGLITVTNADIDRVRGMAAALGRDTLVDAGLLSGEVERSFVWRDRNTGLWMKARPDAVPTASGDYADLKTTTSVQYGDIARTVTRFAYHQQAALVAEGSKICADIEMTSFTFVFVESAPPHCVRCIDLKAEQIARGHQQNVAARRLIADCLASGRWPGPGSGNIVSMDLEDWYCERADADMQMLTNERRPAA